LQIGILDLAKKYFSPDPIKNLEIEILRTEIKNQSRILIAKFLPFQKTITVAGTPTTLVYIRKGVNSYNEYLLRGEILIYNKV
jgi:hypothetical protein